MSDWLEEAVAAAVEAVGSVALDVQEDVEKAGADPGVACESYLRAVEKIGVRLRASVTAMALLEDGGGMVARAEEVTKAGELVGGDLLQVAASAVLLLAILGCPLDCYQPVIEWPQ